MKNGNLTGMYYDYALAAPTMAMGYEDEEETIVGTDTPDILILGMGTGTFAVQCDKYFPGCNITGVEIDACS